MRLILIDSSSGFIFGDTANYLIGGLDEWRDNNSDNDGDIERLSLLAAELLDDCIGEHGRDTGLSDTSRAKLAPVISSIAPTSTARMLCPSSPMGRTKRRLTPCTATAGSKDLSSVGGAASDPTLTPNFYTPLISIHLRRNSKRRGATPGAASTFWVGLFGDCGLWRGGLSRARRLGLLYVIGHVFGLGALELTVPFENLTVVFDKPQGAVEVDVRLRPPRQTFVLEPFNVGKVA